MNPVKYYRIVAIGAALMACGACTPQTSTARAGATLPPHVSTTRTYVFVCPDKSEYVAHIRDGVAWIFRGGGGLKLVAVTGSSPPRYSAGDTALSIDDQIGVLSQSGRLAVACRNDPRRAVWEHAKLDGVDFRAVGNEPPWVLEIREQARIILMTGYEARRIERRLPKPATDPATGVTRWDAGDLRVEVKTGPCRDVMSGEHFDTLVTIYWLGKTLHGCGRPLH